MDDKDLRAIRGLTGLMHDSALGYDAASRHVEDPELKVFLREVSIARAADALKLVGELRRHGVSIAMGGTLFGAMHRSWMALRKHLIGTAEAAVLAECGRGESFLIGGFDEALGRMASSGELSTFLQQQREALMSDYMSIREIHRPLTQAG